MQSQELFPWHGLHEAIQTVDNNGAHAISINTQTHPFHELAGRHFRRVKMFDTEVTRLNVRAEIHAQAPGASHERVHGFFKEEGYRFLAPRSCLRKPAQPDSSLATTG